MKGYTYYFQKLNVGQDIRELIDRIYELTESFPAGERFNLINQMRRASVSIATNMVEGMSRRTGKEQSHYTSTSYGSLMEVLILLILSFDRKYISDKQLDSTKELIDKIAAQLNVLKKKQFNDNP